MASWDDVRRLALALARTTERTSYGNPAWAVSDKVFAWERPLRAADREHLADAPEGPLLGVRVPDLGAKEALLADDPAVYVTTPHFDGHPSVLVHLERIGLDELTELLEEAWLARAPKRVAAAHLAERATGS